MSASNHPNHTALARSPHTHPHWRNANARPPTSWPPHAANAPASAANDNNAGAAPAPKQHDQTRRTVVATAPDAGTWVWAPQK
jgi:hypothetical protein